MTAGRPSSVIVCKLCGDEFNSIAARHLQYRHGWRNDPHPVLSYKRRFGLEFVETQETFDKRSQHNIQRYTLLGRHWTKLRVLQTIRQRQAGGFSLSPTRLLASNPNLYHAARKLYGSWKDALDAAGVEPASAYLPPPGPPIWKPKVVLREIRRAHQSGELFLGAGFRTKHPDLVSAAGKRFGSWTNALSAAGVPTIQRPPTRWTQGEVLKRIQLRVKEKRSLLSRDVWREDAGLAIAARRIFKKTWRDLIRAVGYEYPSHRRWSESVIVDRIRLLQRESQDLCSSSIRKSHPTLFKAAGIYIGSWSEALTAAGIDPSTIRQRKVWDREKVIVEIRKLNQAGMSLRQCDLLRKGQGGLIAVARHHFGKRWPEIVAIALQHE